MNGELTLFHSSVMLTKTFQLYEKVKMFWSEVKSLLTHDNECSPYVTYNKTTNQFKLQSDESLFYSLLTEESIEEIVVFPTTFEQYYYHGETLSDDYIQHSITNVLEQYMTSNDVLAGLEV